MGWETVGRHGYVSGQALKISARVGPPPLPDSWCSQTATTHGTHQLPGDQWKEERSTVVPAGGCRGLNGQLFFSISTLQWGKSKGGIKRPRLTQELLNFEPNYPANSNHSIRFILERATIYGSPYNYRLERINLIEY